jgi:hypothetical protein
MAYGRLEVKVYGGSHSCGGGGSDGVGERGANSLQQSNMAGRRWIRRELPKWEEEEEEEREEEEESYVTLTGRE